MGNSIRNDGQYGIIIPKTYNGNLTGKIKYANINYTNNEPNIGLQVCIANYGNIDPAINHSFINYALQNNANNSDIIPYGPGNAYFSSSSGIQIESGDIIGFYANNASGTNANDTAPRLAVYGDIYFSLS